MAPMESTGVPPHAGYQAPALKAQRQPTVVRMPVGPTVSERVPPQAGHQAPAPKAQQVVRLPIAPTVSAGVPPQGLPKPRARRQPMIATPPSPKVEALPSDMPTSVGVGVQPEIQEKVPTLPPYEPPPPPPTPPQPMSSKANGPNMKETDEAAVDTTHPKHRRHHHLRSRHHRDRHKMQLYSVYAKVREIRQRVWKRFETML
eukprot:gnl/TRDRNA2_/TRDRNA2_155412_c0_seq1.p1 gnl/TRDRNA2_/TRDRNA2_155412_c0~~gnl/TRDRNA2_/TRDRNA2_155412_c0_seq1.p1  ORF type:complete len:202 (+),score=21.43 gnl/TRDRNA2_/TRDRNA2_155412_c0_seq1:1-606(+)